VFEIPEIELKRIAAVLDGSELDPSVLRLSRWLSERFEAHVSLFLSGSTDTVMPEWFEGEPESYDGPLELTNTLNERGCQLMIFPQWGEDMHPLTELDDLVRLSRPPVLVLRNEIEHPETAFGKVLHSLTGNLAEIEHLSYSFTLVRDAGKLVLLHSVAEEEVDGLKETLKVSPGITTRKGDELLRDMTRHAERVLKGIVGASRNEPYDVTYHLGVGDALMAVQHELSMGGYGLLVIGTHIEGKSHIDADDYQLLRRVREIPVLAL